jgi:hypothetical protein
VVEKQTIQMLEQRQKPISASALGAVIGVTPGVAFISILATKIVQILAASKECTPLAETEVINGDSRPRVLLPGRNRLIDDFAEELARQLHEKPIFNHGGGASIVNDRNYTLQRILPATFRSWVEDAGGVVCQSRDREGNKFDASMSEESAKVVLVSHAFVQGLREVVRVNTVRLPVMRSTGAIELLPIGYDAESKILTIETVKYDEAMDCSAAIDVFDNLLKDTAFDLEDRKRSVSVATAMILAPFVDCMISRFDERPAFIVTANSEGAGKTMLVRMAVNPVFGPMKITAPPLANSDKLGELLNSIAQSGALYVVFDNWRGKIENAALEAFVTANQMGGRILGTSYTFDVEKQCLVFVTGNQAVIGSDMRRRSLFIQLFVEEARPEDRVISEPINERIILSRRNEILAACWAYVRAWVDAKCPRSSRRHLSFPEWGYMVGGILENLGYACPTAPPATEFDNRLDSIHRLVEAAFNQAISDEIALSPGELREIARNIGAFVPWVLSQTEPERDSDKRSEWRKFANQCDPYRGRTFTIGDQKINFDSKGQGDSKKYVLRKRA